MAGICIHGSAWPDDISGEAFRQLVLWSANPNMPPEGEWLEELRLNGYLGDEDMLTERALRALQNNDQLLEDQKMRDQWR